VPETVTLEDVLTGRLPKRIERINADPDAWVAH
jgi:hypothetical protein